MTDELEPADDLEPTPELDSEPEAEPTGCRNCGADEIEPGYALALCADCREELIRRPFPPWIKAAAVGVASALLLAAVRSGPAIEAGTEFVRGERAEKAGRHDAAATHFQHVAERYPESTPVLVRYFIASVRADRLEEAQGAFDKLQSRKVNKRLLAEVNAAFDQFENKLAKQAVRNAPDAIRELLKKAIPAKPIPRDDVN